MRTPLRRASLVAPLLVLLTALVACSSGASAGSGTGTPSSAAASGSGSAPAGERTAVRFALDWTPNTNHTGLYVAQQQGWFEQAGIDLQILPYNTALPETLVDAGNAEFGVSFQDSTTVAQ